LFLYKQIVTTGEKDDFSLHTENLSSILKKVPEGTKVAVVSVVGAFRTGKSFILNFFLRYLRSTIDCDDLSEDWMTMDGTLL
jgi:atlastin